MMISKSTFWRAMRLLVLVSIAFVVIINEREWLAVLPAALLHEAGHYIAARLCGAPTGGIRMDLLGARIEVRGILSYGKEFAVACGGPVMNLLSAAMVFGLQQQALLKDTEAVSFFLRFPRFRAFEPFAGGYAGRWANALDCLIRVVLSLRGKYLSEDHHHPVSCSSVAFGSIRLALGISHDFSLYFHTDPALSVHVSRRPAEGGMKFFACHKRRLRYDIRRRLDLIMV